MDTRLSTRPANPQLPAFARWLANLFARWTARVDSMPMPTRHRMGAWERTGRNFGRE